jgi:hypothetical protein
MLGQLFRQEAVDGYTESWLGEVSDMSLRPRPALALLGVVMLTSFITALIFGSYTRHATLSGVVSGDKEETLISSSAATFRVGELLLVDAQHTHVAREPLMARVTSVTTGAVSGRAVCRIKVEIPAELRKDVGLRVLLRAPGQRRRIYQWMFPCLSNS